MELKQNTVSSWPLSPGCPMVLSDLYPTQQSSAEGHFLSNFTSLGNSLTIMQLPAYKL